MSKPLQAASRFSRLGADPIHHFSNRQEQFESFATLLPFVQYQLLGISIGETGPILVDRFPKIRSGAGELVRSALAAGNDC